MILVIGRVKTDPERREELIRVAHAVTSASREEEGCIDYRFYEDSEAPNDFLFVEEWRDEDALQTHFGTPHIAEFMRAIPGTITGAPEVHFHTIASTRDLATVAASRS